MNIKTKYQNRPAQSHRSETDPFYQSREYKEWRKKVINKSEGLCVHCLDPRIKNKSGTYGEVIKAGLVTDHIIPINAGGSPLDPNNGQYLCKYHDSVKSNKDKQYYQ